MDNNYAQRLVRGIVTAKRNGNTADAEMLRGELERIHQVKPEPPSMAASIGRGMYDVGQGIKQLYLRFKDSDEAAKYQAEVDEEIARYERGRGPDAGFDVGRLGGQIAATAPAALVPGGAATSWGVRGLSGAASGGLAAGTLYTPEGESRTRNVLTGATGGAIAGTFAKPVIEFAGRLAKSVKSGLTQPRAIKLSGQIEQALQQQGMTLKDMSAEGMDALRRNALTMLEASGELDANALARQARIQKFDIRPTAAQVSRDPRAWATERNLSKLDDVGDPLLNRYQEQNQRISDILDGTRNRFGSEADTLDVAGEAVEDAAKARAASMQRTVSDAYEQFENAAPGFELPKARLSENVRGVLDDFEDSIPGSVKRRIAQLTDTDGSRTFTPTEAMKLDKLITDTMGDSRASRRAASELKGALRQVLEEVEAGPLYAAAKKKAAERFAAIGTPKQLTAKLVEGEMDPEKVVPKLLSGSIRQAETLAKFVSSEAPDAWAKVRASAMNEIIDKSFPSGNFSQAMYNRTIRRIGERRLANLFGDDGAKELMELGRVARYLQASPANAPVNTSNTTSALMNHLQRIGNSGLEGIPMVGPFLRGIVATGQEAQERTANRLAVEGSISGLLPREQYTAPMGLLQMLPPAAGMLNAQ